MGWKITVLFIAAALFALVAVLGRYELVHADKLYAFRIDRWTGEIVFFAAFDGTRAQIKDKPP